MISGNRATLGQLRAERYTDYLQKQQQDLLWNTKIMTSSAQKLSEGTLESSKGKKLYTRYWYNDNGPKELEPKWVFNPIVSHP